MYILVQPNAFSRDSELGKVNMMTLVNKPRLVVQLGIDDNVFAGEKNFETPWGTQLEWIGSQRGPNICGTRCQKTVTKSGKSNEPLGKLDIANFSLY